MKSVEITAYSILAILRLIKIQRTGDSVGALWDCFQDANKAPPSKQPHYALEILLLPVLAMANFLTSFPSTFITSVQPPAPHPGISFM